MTLGEVRLVRLAARYLRIDWIDTEESLVIVNGDQLIDAELKSVVREFQAASLDGGIIVFHDVHPRWSFVKCDADGLVIEAAEKRPIKQLGDCRVLLLQVG